MSDVIQQCWFCDPDGMVWTFTLLEDDLGRRQYRCTDFDQRVIAASVGMAMPFERWVGAMCEGAVRFAYEGAVSDE